MKQRQYLRDYRPSAFQVPEIELKLDIQDSFVEVSSSLRVEKLDREVSSLRLDGREMDLREVRIDGEVLPASAYHQDTDSLTLNDVPDSFELAITVRIDPYSNSSLEGLYYAGGMLCSQCESHGFSRITYCLDRPDVLSVYRVELEADQLRFPVLLANGERESHATLDNGRHSACWVDPHPKPCYLFAAVAGDLACRNRPFTTADGRDVRIAFYCDHGIEDRLDHAMDSLERAMRWDERRYGLAYDLDTYNVVVAGAFNMGAMENKGLNIFNPKYVLASPDTATDQDFASVEAVIGHEYFHNWTGNRVTCRDWFQLSLKEGLTVFRDQQFSADHGAGPAQRVAQVRLLRARQFAEDAGPLAHPVRPDSFLEMNNFYTVTVYEKGAELVRLLHARLGEDGFRKGMDLYFARHDGQAVTIEDFLAAHGDANGVDTSGILRWYSQAGTPLVELTDSYSDGRYRLHARQRVPKRPDAAPVLIPIRLSLLASDGSVLLPSRVLEFDQGEQSWEFEVPQTPVPVLFEGLSAPIRWDYTYSPEQLQCILLHAEDPFSRWEAAQRLYLQQVDAAYAGEGDIADFSVFACLLDDVADGGVIASLLTPPRPDELSDRYSELDPVRLVAAAEAVENQLAGTLGPQLEGAFRRLREASPYRFEPAQVARRSLLARILSLWVRSGAPAAIDAAESLYNQADNLSDRMAALGALNRRSGPRREALLRRFHTDCGSDPLLLDRWFALQAQLPGEDGLKTVRQLLEHADFDPVNPNRVRAVLGSFGMLNPSALYAADGEGLRLLAAQIQRFDRINPQLASRLIVPCAVLGKLVSPYREQMRSALEDARGQVASPDVIEQLDRILA